MSSMFLGLAASSALGGPERLSLLYICVRPVFGGEGMDLGLLQEFEFLGRLFLAGLCGAFIGYERANRRKEAGIRTHLVVSMGSALFMIVSKYGFADMIPLHGVALDPSRVAAQIVTGVGFLGAGMIFVRGQNISGLTTAAGIWATAGIGMAVGSGLYLLGVLGTALIFLIQIFLHRHFTWLRAPSMEHLCLHIRDGCTGLDVVRAALRERKLFISSFKAVPDKEGQIIMVDAHIKVPYGYDLADLLDLLKKDGHVLRVEIKS